MKTKLLRRLLVFVMEFLIIVPQFLFVAPAPALAAVEIEQTGISCEQISVPVGQEIPPNSYTSRQACETLDEANYYACCVRGVDRSIPLNGKTVDEVGNSCRAQGGLPGSCASNNATVLSSCEAECVSGNCFCPSDCAMPAGTIISATDTSVTLYGLRSCGGSVAPEPVACCINGKESTVTNAGKCTGAGRTLGKCNQGEYNLKSCGEICPGKTCFCPSGCKNYQVSTGQVCEDHDVCKAGEYFDQSNNRCQTKKGTNAFCTQSEECKSGSCQIIQVAGASTISGKCVTNLDSRIADTVCRNEGKIVCTCDGVKQCFEGRIGITCGDYCDIARIEKGISDEDAALKAQLLGDACTPTGASNGFDEPCEPFRTGLKCLPSKFSGTGYSCQAQSLAQVIGSSCSTPVAGSSDVQLNDTVCNSSATGLFCQYNVTQKTFRCEFPQTCMERNADRPDAAEYCQAVKDNFGRDLVTSAAAIALVPITVVGGLLLPSVIASPLVGTIVGDIVTYGPVNYLSALASTYIGSTVVGVGATIGGIQLFGRTVSEILNYVPKNIIVQLYQTINGAIGTAQGMFRTGVAPTQSPTSAFLSFFGIVTGPQKAAEGTVAKVCGYASELGGIMTAITFVCDNFTPRGIKSKIENIGK